MRALRLAVVALVCGGALAAQRAGTYEIGAFGAFTKYDPDFNLENKIGGGARLGYFLGERIGLEVDVLFQPRHAIPGSSAGFEPLIGSGSLVLNLLNLASNSFYVLGGYSRLDFGSTSPYQFTDGGFHGAAGDRIMFGDRAAVRVEARYIYTPETGAAFGSKAAAHLVATAGLSVFRRSTPPLDSDKDRVGDRGDACPDTPLGATVDRRGCPADADADLVFNGIDQCPDTPGGATVDPRGCPADSDVDHVLDGIDQCAATPSGATVDPKGCPADADTDTVFDGIDQCPHTPAGAMVDLKGCPTDSDGDTVFDGIDRCPGTPAGTTVDSSGCPLDTDRDGVSDSADQCPNTPSGTPVDATGCPIVGDSDGDGVDDRRDRCPGTPPNSRVDSNGCLILFEERAPAPGAAASRPTLILKGVNFQSGRSVLTRDSYVVLDQVAASLVANPEIRIEIAGYTDNTGSAALNLRLSNARALAVRAFLARRGVGPGRMVAKGYGLANPIATNTTPQGRAQNRRVELHKLP
ncbi:MAG: OmpA family protein [Gemmatimonadales bacterium]